MFGFFKPGVESFDYRSIYSRCCQHQRQHYGLLSLPFHSYEAVFLYTCALDAGLFPESIIRQQTCCKLRRGKGILTAPDTQIGQFCASLAVLLTAIKLQDDIRDRSGVMARCLHWVLRKHIAKAFNYFDSLDCNFTRTVNDYITGHLTLEKEQCHVTVRQFLESTAEAFSYVFGLVSKVHPYQEWSELFTSIGYHIGAAIVAFDCAFDWKHDKVFGNYNPVKDAAGAIDAARACTDELDAIIHLCELSFGSVSRSAEIARSLRQSVSQTFGISLETNCVGNEAYAVAHKRKKHEDVVLYATCSVPVDSGSKGGCCTPKREPTYVHLNEGETCGYCCIQAVFVLGCIGCCMAKGGCK